MKVNCIALWVERIVISLVPTVKAKGAKDACMAKFS